MVDVLLSGMGERDASGTIVSAILEMGSRACVSFTEANPRVKTAAGRMATTTLAAICCCVAGGGAYPSAA
jgi:hypothetical protein